MHRIKRRVFASSKCLIRAGAARRDSIFPLCEVEPLDHNISREAIESNSFFSSSINLFPWNRGHPTICNIRSQQDVPRELVWFVQAIENLSRPPSYFVYEREREIESHSWHCKRETTLTCRSTGMEVVGSLASALCGLALRPAKKIWDCNANIETLENKAPHIRHKINAFSDHKQQNPGFTFSQAAEECLERVRKWNTTAQALLGSRHNRIWSPIKRYKRSNDIAKSLSAYDDLLSQIQGHEHELNVHIEELKKRASRIQATLDKFNAPKHRNPDFRYSGEAEAWLTGLTEWTKKAQALLGSQEKRSGAISELVRTCENDLLPHIERYEREELRVIRPSTSFSVRSCPQDRGLVNYVRRGVPEANDMFGRHGEQLDEVVNALLDPQAPGKWFGLLGMGGCGKTTLASFVHNDQRVRQHFHDNIVWITVKRDASEDDLRALLLDALEWGGMKERAQNAGTLEHVQHLAQNVARGICVLLILDDVWEMSQAKGLDFIAGPSSYSRVLVTTRKKGILSMLGAKALPVHELSEDESKMMFWKFAFYDSLPSDPDIVKVAERIASKCEGLPLALEVIGSAMAEYRHDGPQVWEERYQKMHLLNDPDVEKQMFQRLKFSYDELSNKDEKLQECFLYMAAFPEDRRIEFDDLRKCWIAVGSELSPLQIVSELERRCLVKTTDSRFRVADQIQWYKHVTVHDMVRKLCIRILKGKYPPQEEHEKGCLFGYDCPPGISPTCSKVSFIGKKVTSSFLSDIHVRDVLLLDGCKVISGVDDSLIIDHFENVKVLSLNRCYDQVRFILESISKLRNLQVLDLRYSGVPQLPDALFSLTSLKVLNCNHIRKLNFGLLPQLFNLEELELHSSEELAVDLSGISSLHKLRHLKLDLYGATPIKIPHSLGALVDIETLVLRAKSMDLADFTGPWQLVNLRRCNISVQSTIKLDWKRMFKNSKQLQDFSIDGVQDGENNAESLEWPQLQFLTIRSNETMKDLSSLKGFQWLRELHLDCSGIQFFSLEGSFPCLERLELESYKKLALALDLSGISSLHKLRHLELKLYNATIKTLELESCKELAVDLSAISRLHKLRHLELHLNATIKIPHSLGALVDIETLVLRAKSMDFGDFTGLWQLVNLRRCHICVKSTIKLDWKRMFKNSKQLQHFTIDGVQDGENNAESHEWPQLQFLTITNNETMKDLSSLKGFQWLRELHLDCSGIQFFSLEGSFPCLERLELRNLHIAQSEFKDDLAASLPNLKSLTFVVALDNTWEHLPLFVTQLPKDLDTLDVVIKSYMRRLLMPTERSQLKVKWFTLSLLKGCMRQLPNDFFEPTDQMTALRGVTLVRIENIPSSIASLPGLEELVLSDHDDVVWPQLSSDNHGLGLFPRLKVVYCPKGTKVPPWLEERPDLKIYGL
ncbi:disease resistance protein RPS5-like isoform X2 [Selaginella moellendorffii]|uniref:disease resistance protein RPS5-like isoform X2 n=1 Tax=Selaginella moellendorffii TaxID=88036 RepID=UPI000D1C805B|nr:disease resistance protein RPS5-like isoform X2 [Selaginella moellendorffii]|eukprot:XP_024522186.1 disease resistance protein RPS5-like isoform X2 [Selaginella moellendorffii]